MVRREPQQHLKIANYLREEIRTGRLAAGDFLPSEAELCEQFHTSRGPVRQAMAALRSEGKISSSRGRRSVILGDFNAESFEATYSVYARYQESGITPDQHILWLARRPATAAAAESLRLKEGDPIVFVHRVRSFAGENRVIQEHYFPLNIGRHILDYEESDGSLHAVLTARGVDFDNISRILEFGLASQEDGELLGINEGDPLCVTRQMIHDHNGNPVEYSIFKFRADHLQLSMSTVRGAMSPLRISLISPEN